ncbi:sodium bile acid symporter family-domain-containing protein [Jimgerdemannia flammicorona]|uniref:Sodium bile acid symporter family-domain-containing protein n=1 Tax=Jimgerdemannia flammicorona TaxID=994334 RepID=A0A433QIA4_9FUNG|nr:sodium bile acid symporter family-domain-containing protein [Jimgerdemannia flammicorona]
MQRCLRRHKHDLLANRDRHIPHLPAVFRGLSLLDRYLFVWILLVMVIGILLGYFVPSIQAAFETAQLDSVSLPIAIGLLWMMYPIMCKVQYEMLSRILTSRQIWIQLAFSLFVNWIVGPLIMTALAWAALPDLPTYRTGVVLVGLARCIAMVLIWNHLAGGDENYCAILVAVNSVLQIILYSFFAELYLDVVPGWFGAPAAATSAISIWTVARSVLIFLGIPLAAAIITRFSLRAAMGHEWYTTVFLPYFGPTSLLGLLFTVLVMFAMQGHHVIDNIGQVFRVAVPLLVYFAIMFSFTLLACRQMRFTYEEAVVQAFTGASNNFELAIAVAVGIYGIKSDQALAAVVGPLIEVPVLLGLVYVTLWLRKRLSWGTKNTNVDEEQQI